LAGNGQYIEFVSFIWGGAYVRFGTIAPHTLVDSISRLWENPYLNQIRWARCLTSKNRFWYTRPHRQITPGYTPTSVLTHTMAHFANWKPAAELVLLHVRHFSYHPWQAPRFFRETSPHQGDPLFPSRPSCGDPEPFSVSIKTLHKSPSKNRPLTSFPTFSGYRHAVWRLWNARPARTGNTGATSDFYHWCTLRGMQFNILECVQSRDSEFSI
jgi:hypothetical protein